MLKAFYERVTGRPYRTVRSMAAEFGPTPATRYPELAGYSDAELIACGEQLLARARQRAGERRLRVGTARYPARVGGGGRR